MDTIERFIGEYEFLSNFYPCRIVYLDKVWPSAEHLYQAIKTKDNLEREEIRNAKTPAFAKKIGKNMYFKRWLGIYKRKSDGSCCKNEIFSKSLFDWKTHWHKGSLSERR